MSRTQRLFQLMQHLRRHRYPVAGATLASELGVSLRTLYRDIATLQTQGAQIEGEAGIGYLLRPGFLLPPLMLTEEEVDALVLGMRWVGERTDSELAAAARDVLAKVVAVLPPDLRRGVDEAALLIGPADHGAPATDAGSAQWLPPLRRAIRQEKRVEVEYANADGKVTTRTVWPFALGFFDRVRVLVAWCELRMDYRHFRVDRIRDLAVAEERYPIRRQTLLREWRAAEGIDAQATVG